MPVVQTMVAICDYKPVLANRECAVQFVLDPRTTQPFDDLAAANWAIDGPGQYTYCPSCRILCGLKIGRT